MAKIDEWLQPDKLTLIEGWARTGLTNEQIAHNMGINPDTLYKWKNKYNEINDTLKKGKEVVDFEVENALLKRALGYQRKVVTYDSKGKIIGVKTEEVLPDTTAQIFWLKNRRPEQWREKVELQHNGADEINKNIQNIANLINNPKKNRTEEDV